MCEVEGVCLGDGSSASVVYLAQVIGSPGQGFDYASEGRSTVHVICRDCKLVPIVTRSTGSPSRQSCSLDSKNEKNKKKILLFWNELSNH